MVSAVGTSAPSSPSEPSRSVARVERRPARRAPTRMTAANTSPLTRLCLKPGARPASSPASSASQADSLRSATSVQSTLSRTNGIPSCSPLIATTSMTGLTSTAATTTARPGRRPATADLEADPRRDEHQHAEPQRAHHPQQLGGAEPVDRPDDADQQGRPVDEELAVEAVRLRVPRPRHQQEPGLVGPQRQPRRRAAGRGPRMPPRSRRRDGAGPWGVCTPDGSRSEALPPRNTPDVDAQRGRGTVGPMLWRVRAALPDRPGALAALAQECGKASVNIVGLQVFPGGDRVTDELVLSAPSDWTRGRPARAGRAGGRGVGGGRDLHRGGAGRPTHPLRAGSAGDPGRARVVPRRRGAPVRRRRRGRGRRRPDGADRRSGAGADPAYGAVHRHRARPRCGDGRAGQRRARPRDAADRRRVRAVGSGAGARSTPCRARPSPR